MRQHRRSLTEYRQAAFLAAGRAWAAVTRLCLGMLLGLIRAYQVVISPALGQHCRFYPSCSAYAAEALRLHGLFRGSGLALLRILRCNPWSEGGIDPVPPAVHSLPSLQELPGRHGK